MEVEGTELVEAYGVSCRNRVWCRGETDCCGTAADYLFKFIVIGQSLSIMPLYPRKQLIWNSRGSGHG